MRMFNELPGAQRWKQTKITQFSTVTVPNEDIIPHDVDLIELSREFRQKILGFFLTI